MVQWVRRVRRQDDIARRRYRLGEIGEAFLRAQRDGGFAILVQLYAEPAIILIDQSPAQTRDTARGRIAVDGWLRGCLS